MHSKYIFHNRPKKLQRQNYLLKLLKFGAIIFMIITMIIVAILVNYSEYDAAATLLVFAFGLTGFLVNSILSQQFQLSEVTDKTLGLLRDRWDSLRNDDELVSIFAQSKKNLSNEQKFKLRLFMTTYLDLYILIIRYLRYGYFISDDEDDLAIVFENMLRTLFNYPFTIDVWKTTNEYGKGCLQDEYSGTILFVVNQIIDEIHSENIN